MIDPRLALLGFALLAAFTAAVTWPRRGLAARLLRARRDAERERREDALKYLFHRGTEGLAVHPDALAGALEVRPAVARQLLERLTLSGWAASTGPAGHALTDAGRREAMRIVRSHRLVEQFLADHTGIAPDEWHQVAEDQEHLLTTAEIEALAVRLGQPRFDPHGEPIPTQDGELPVTDTRPTPPPGVRTLADIPLGETVRVRHLAAACRGAQRRRLLDLGVVPGTAIVPERRSAAGDPVAYRIRGALIALRRHQAAWIEVASGAPHEAPHEAPAL